MPTPKLDRLATNFKHMGVIDNHASAVFVAAESDKEISRRRGYLNLDITRTDTALRFQRRQHHCRRHRRPTTWHRRGEGMASQLPLQSVHVARARQQAPPMLWPELRVAAPPHLFREKKTCPSFSLSIPSAPD
uniref:Uncharacterized protein n=1 Tax=Triticum urartu TaxID=4572 RepID=A0A8R7QR74_TRIUA